MTRGCPGWPSPSRSRRRPTIRPANPVTPYDPSVAARTMSTTARRRDEGSTGRRVRSARGWRPPIVVAVDGRGRRVAVPAKTVLSYRPARRLSSRAFLLLTLSLTFRGPAWPVPARSAARCRWAASIPQSSGMNRVRAHRRYQPNLQPFTIIQNGTSMKALVCTRCRRTSLKSPSSAPAPDRPVAEGGRFSFARPICAASPRNWPNLRPRNS